MRSVGTRKLQANHLGEKSLVIIPEIKGAIVKSCEVPGVYSSFMTEKFRKKEVISGCKSEEPHFNLRIKVGFIIDYNQITIKSHKIL